MKIKLLRKWNKLTKQSFIVDATYNMSFVEYIIYCWLTFTRKLFFGKLLLKEFNAHHAEFHYLGYDIGPRVMAWRLSKNGEYFHNVVQNPWEIFAYRYRKYSRKYWLPKEQLRRAIKGEED